MDQESFPQCKQIQRMSGRAELLSKAYSELGSLEIRSLVVKRVIFRTNTVSVGGNWMYSDWVILWSFRMYLGGNSLEARFEKLEPTLNLVAKRRRSSV